MNTRSKGLSTTVMTIGLLLSQGLTLLASNKSTTLTEPILQAKAANVTLALNGGPSVTLQATQVNNGSTGVGTLTYEIQKVVHAKADENQTITLSTPNAQNFTEIVYASYNFNTVLNGFYGTSTERGVCSGWNMSNATFASKLNQNFPNTANTGSIVASNGVLTDPCPGVPKNMVVVAAYGPKQTELTYDASEMDKTNSVLLIATDQTGQKSYTIATVTVVQTLPIKLSSFDLTAINNGVKIDWSTSLEENNQMFEIQRGTDLVSFKSIAKVAGRGNSKTLNKYSYNDAMPNHGLNYYRLLQFDVDGKKTVVATKAISYQLNNSKEVKVLPNPVTSTANVHFKEGAKKAVLSTINGQKLKEFELTAKQNNLRIDVTDIPYGVYTITLSYDDGATVTKIIKQ
jgi:hypothetical protein